MNEIMSGGTTATQNAAFLPPYLQRRQSRNYRRDCRLCGAMRHTPPKVETGGAFSKIVGTGGDKRPQLQHFHYFYLSCGGGRRNEGSKARQPCGFFLERIVWKPWCQYSAEGVPKMYRTAEQRVGMCFFFAQKYHTLHGEYVGALSPQGYRFRTVFSILGPDQSRNTVHAASRCV